MHSHPLFLVYLTTLQGQQADSEGAYVHSGKQLVSLADGFAFELEKGSYCRLTHEDLIAAQMNQTHMSDYPEIIKSVNKVGR